MKDVGIDPGSWEDKAANRRRCVNRGAEQYEYYEEGRITEAKQKSSGNPEHHLLTVELLRRGRVRASHANDPSLIPGYGAWICTFPNGLASVKGTSPDKSV